MRIPLFIAIPACLLTIALFWWTSTRDMDFLTPPSEAQLQAIRNEALASLPVSIIQNDAISVKVPNPDAADPIPDPEPIAEPVDLGDTTTPPVLDTYSNRAPDGADKLIALAKALEQAGAFQRSLLAYERVLDLSQGNPEQIQTAIIEIQRLRPTLANWNTDESAMIPLVVHIGTGEKFAEILPEILDRVMKDLHNASSGLLEFTYDLNIGRSIQTTDAPTPVAVWITGTGEGAPSTDVLSFTTDDPDSLGKDLLKTAFNLVRGGLAKSTSYNPAPEASEDPLLSLDSHITRLLWKEFGASLTPEPEEEEEQ